ncbi:restriction endonuclease [Ralstonia nicotianae]|uniref:restriction endonuclease n=1 Tax=Ralstonia solanacearum species complex TaxID=3116862 RepID=UPI00036ADC69|nr:restriction endonuclease [Ralstonia pseudosolanacearum]MCK4125764.1 restriction endonuclease [Ralstonia pseudosolanacearum]QIK17897.1 restriction endonuclease [Ralstonia solanacearum]
MKIFERVPASWRDLQNLVGQLFEEIGCEVQIGQKVNLVRGGTKEIDVRVVDPVTVPPSCYLCECKHWKALVDQETVHAFRTVMDDQGAHRGFIISSSGFQSGARRAVKNTNTNLFTFDELQATFFERWRLSMAQRHMPLADQLALYWDPCIGELPARRFDPRDVEVMSLFQEANRPFIALTRSDIRRGGELPLPMTIPVLDETFTKVSELTLSSYRQFYDWIVANAARAVTDYRRHMGLDAPDVQPKSLATDAIEAGILPPLPQFDTRDRDDVEELAAARDLRLQELRLSDRNVHRGQHLRFIRTDGDVWHALRDSRYTDGTACVTACVHGVVLRCHESDDGEGTHQFVVWEFDGSRWKLDIWEHSMAFDEHLDLTQEELEDA